jgi:DNA-binding transcriptional regulator LsrR (DeoR family)
MPTPRGREPSDRLQLTGDVARWYFVEGLSQGQIGERTGLPRSAVARLLEDARRLKIVEITVNPPIPTVPELEARLVRDFGLQAARVLERRTASDDEALRALGRLGALVLGQLLRDDMILGIAWGTASQAVVRALAPAASSGVRPLTGVRVVQLVGGVGASYRQIDAAEQVHRAARVLNAQHFYINAPLVVSSPLVAAALRADHSVAEVLELGSRSDVALLGIGTTEPESCTVHRAGYLTSAELAELQEAGSVGGFCHYYFDIRGCRTPLRRLEECGIGVSWEDLHRFGTVVAVAGGRSKARAVLGALRTGIADILVTDDAAAERLLALS